MKNKFVYFIQQKVTKCIKIGTAKKLSSRLHTLQTDSPFDLEVLALIDPGTISGMKLEYYLHTKFRQHNLRGEWFSDAKEIIDFAKIYKYNEKEIKKLAPELASLPELQSDNHIDPPAIPRKFRKQTIYVEPIRRKFTEEELKQERIWIDNIVAKGLAEWTGSYLIWLTKKPDPTESE